MMTGKEFSELMYQFTQRYHYDVLSMFKTLETQRTADEWWNSYKEYVNSIIKFAVEDAERKDIAKKDIEVQTIVPF